ncbi:guanine nucleotide-binding protein G(I)/G(S)/G(O) subunit gamma-3 isoform X2 [Rhea pennata]|uniref:guanine nucleotide-binding protein G(I)/G(S)/G(O) subunit gamma-3 isoform X2 n=1 Tax=Rhea pennata TaxID=8795 RepID=UPI002E256409
MGLPPPRSPLCLWLRPGGGGGTRRGGASPPLAPRWCRPPAPSILGTDTGTDTGPGSGPPRTSMKGETPVNSTMSIGQARKMVEQLKIEASMCRIKVSKAAADLMTYCDAHACEDPLITPVPTSENPFREKKFFCALL